MCFFKKLKKVEVPKCAEPQQEESAKYVARMCYHQYSTTERKFLEVTLEHLIGGAQIEVFKVISREETLFEGIFQLLASVPDTKVRHLSSTDVATENSWSWRTYGDLWVLVEGRLISFKEMPPRNIQEFFIKGSLDILCDNFQVNLLKFFDDKVGGCSEPPIKLDETAIKAQVAQLKIKLLEMMSLKA